jgi:predicted dienelactone hydrolase
MKALSLIAAVALSLIALPHAWAAEAAPRQIAVRTELHDIHTLTLTDQQFLTGDTSGKPTTITGELRIAQGSGRLPVVVLQHGSGGMGANIEMWSRALNEIGISTFALDGFTGRGLTEVRHSTD